MQFRKLFLTYCLYDVLSLSHLCPLCSRHSRLLYLLLWINPYNYLPTGYKLMSVVWRNNSGNKDISKLKAGRVSSCLIESASDFRKNHLYQRWVPFFTGWLLIELEFRVYDLKKLFHSNLMGISFILWASRLDTYSTCK